MKINDIIDFIDIRFKEWKEYEKYDIQSFEDFTNLNMKIERRISNYRLEPLLLKIHKMVLKEKYDNFIMGFLTKYALLNSSKTSGWYPVEDFDDEIEKSVKILKILRPLLFPQNW